MSPAPELGFTGPGGAGTGAARPVRQREAEPGCGRGGNPLETGAAPRLRHRAGTAPTSRPAPRQRIPLAAELAPREEATKFRKKKGCPPAPN